ncbi:hypothetical protein EWB00_000353 [Schistosoma japonicum]|uniref:Uncharacterized protein n=1 Tax=Schistosoma japonicum TaxID=6182 RepID=A0A4Z2CL12_SCHJA|nr:hypothetical protein EWB00_000353 [Schistosoma japonicum]
MICNEEEKGTVLFLTLPIIGREQLKRKIEREVEELSEASWMQWLLEKTLCNQVFRVMAVGTNIVPTVWERVTLAWHPVTTLLCDQEYPRVTMKVTGAVFLALQSDLGPTHQVKGLGLCPALSQLTQRWKGLGRRYDVLEHMPLAPRLRGRVIIRKRKRITVQERTTRVCQETAITEAIMIILYYLFYIWLV